MTITQKLTEQKLKTRDWAMGKEVYFCFQNDFIDEKPYRSINSYLRYYKKHPHNLLNKITKANEELEIAKNNFQFYNVLWKNLLNEKSSRLI